MKSSCKSFQSKIYISFLLGYGDAFPSGKHTPSLAFSLGSAFKIGVPRYVDILLMRDEDNNIDHISQYLKKITEPRRDRLHTILDICKLEYAEQLS